MNIEKHNTESRIEEEEGSGFFNVHEIVATTSPANT